MRATARTRARAVSHARSTGPSTCHAKLSAERTSPAAEDANGERYELPVLKRPPRDTRALCVGLPSLIVFEGA
jgi:hypothetical protein